MWAVDLAKKQRSNPHAVEEYLAAWQRELLEERLMQWQRHLTMAAVFGVVIGLIAGFLLHRVWWQAALVGGGMFGGATWLIRRNKSQLGWLMDQSLVMVFFLPILVIVVGILVMM
jgi:FtsH-binding integral membrane protein